MRRWTLDARPILRRMVFCAVGVDGAVEKSCSRSLGLLPRGFDVDGGDRSEDAVC